MERSAIHLLAKRGKSQRQIAEELGRNRRTIARVLREPVERRPAKRYRRSKVEPYRAQIVAWLGAGLTAARMLELAREDAACPYRGGDNVFRSMVRRIRQEQQQQHAATDVPIRFEGLPGEYLQVDWGEVRRFPFAKRPPATRYFLACRLKYSRWSWIRFTADMRRETLFRGLVDCCLTLGWVPWVLVFDNMKTVTSGRDADGEAVWTPGLLQLAGECGFHPQACDPGAANQKGSVEALVKWVKGNFLPGRTFADDADLAAQAADWLACANARPSAATGAPPAERLAAEAARAARYPRRCATTACWSPGRCRPRRWSRSAATATPCRWRTSARRSRRASTATGIRLWRDTACIADHPRAPDGAGRRVVDPAHFAPLFPQKPRVQALLYREVLLGLGRHAPAFLGELSRRHRDRLREELLAVYALYQRHGADECRAAMVLADGAGAYSADALTLLLAAPPHPVPRAPLLLLPGVPPQGEVDRLLSAYEALAQVDEALPEMAS